MKAFFQLLNLFILVATTCAQVPSTLEKTLFYQDTNATFRGSNQPLVDTNGNVIVIATQFGFGCGFNVCGVQIYSIAPNGTLNWLKPDGGFAANTVNGVALGQDNTIYFQGFFGLGQIYAWAADGTPAPGWPINIGFPLDTAAHTLLIDPVDGSILAKGGTNFSFGAFPGRVAAYRPDSSIKWQTDFANAANNTPGMAIGPDNNVYTTSDQGVILDRNTGQQLCGFGPFAPLVGGSAGVFTHSGSGTQIIRMNADCTTAPIFTTTRTDLEVQEYDNSIIFAIDRDPLDPTHIQLLAVRADGTLLWRNSGFLLGGGVSAISAIRNGRLYVIGVDIVDQKRKLFILDENTGDIVDAFDTTGACGPCGVAVGPDSSVYLNDLQSVTIYRLARAQQRPAQPTGVSAIAGDGSVYLRWDHPPTAVDQYSISLVSNIGDQALIQYVPTSVNSLAGTQQNTSVLITKLPSGSAIRNGVAYQLTVMSESAGILSPASAAVSVIPGGFAGHLPKKPLSPILFLHGWNGSGTLNGTFSNTLDFMQHTLQWRFGGQLYHLQESMATHVDRSGTCDLTDCNDDITVDHEGNFFTASFGNPFANYASGDNGISHWGAEVETFVNKLRGDGAIPIGRHLVLMAHSNGGLAARDFIGLFADANQISDLITYGTPHRGADLFTVPEAPFAAVTAGAQDAEFTCTNGTVNLSPFLAELGATTLPLNINYTAISSVLSHSVKVSAVFGVVHVTIPAERVSDCQSAKWDGLVPQSSANFEDAPPGSRRLSTNTFHSDQGNDFPTILCALNPACIQINVFSPVDVAISAPDGNIIAKNVTSIPGASYVAIDDAPGHQTVSALIPFPQGGNYTIMPTAKAGALPSDTFTITITQNGVVKTVVNGAMIRDIPPDGYRINVNSFPRADAGSDQVAECSGHNGTLVNLNGSQSFDPDGDPLAFEWRDENGNLLGSTSIVSTSAPLGIHTFTLTVRDGRGGVDSARTSVLVRDTTPPVLKVGLTPSVLWPPNHHIIPITASIQASDTCDAAPRIQLISIVSSEPAVAAGAGPTEPDIEGATFGTDDRSFLLRAERDGSGPGRTYTITYEADDHSGNKSVRTATVVVPHNQ